MPAKEFPANSPISDSFHRREFLRQAAAATAVIGIDALFGPLEAARPPRPQRVVILGAGLSGLCAAYELQQRGHHPIILEAEPALVGGRVRTLRFGDDLYGEAGAMRIPARHHLTRHYIRQFGLPLRPFVELNRDAYYLVHNHRERIHRVPHLDARYAVQGIGAGPHSIWTDEFHEIAGGMDRLPRAFASRLREKPRMGCQVIALHQDGEAATVIYKHQGALYHVRGDAILCTLPVPVLGRLEFTPALSQAKQQALRAIRYESAHKVLLAARRRFWESEDGIFGGASYTDLPTGSTYYPSDNAGTKNPLVSSGPGVLLASYTLEKAARRLAAIPEPRRTAYILHQLERLHPQLRDRGLVTHTRCWDWDAHPWSRGAFAAPAQAAPLIQAVAAPEGRIFFAGEHTSQHPTWMQGALESALRAIHQILLSRH